MNRDDFPYQPYYCEENVWHLASSDRFEDGRVVFVSNAERRVALWCQRASADPEQPILWDYHVLFLARGDDDWIVYDHDTTLGFAVPAREYFAKTFRFDAPPFGPRFSIVTARDYAETLATDRSHMRNEDGDWLSPPPSWPTIGEGTNLESFIQAAQSGHSLASIFVTDELGTAR